MQHEAKKVYRARKPCVVCLVGPGGIAIGLGISRPNRGGFDIDYLRM